MGVTLYVGAGAALSGLYWFWFTRRDRRFRAVRLENIEAGLTEPASLHPSIDPNLCLGCASCVTACPEQSSHPVLGIIAGKAELVEPTSCIGHGACKTACPVDAITLVFGTQNRGVDIPNVSDEFETSVPGIYIAGELGGMGLIRNAVGQGRQALDFIAKTRRPAAPDGYDVIIVGAGPAGLSASLRAMELGLRYLTIEQDSLGGTVFQFPRGKVVMTAPMDLPVYGKVRIRETSKEALLALWQKVEADTGLRVNYHESVKEVQGQAGHFQVTTDKGNYTSANVLLAIGRRGTPRKLGVPGEELPKVVYRLIDPEQYRHQRVLVVGGGDSALEAAVAIADEPGTNVTLSYRSEAFGRAKAKNRERIAQAEANGKVDVLLQSNVMDIDHETVSVSQLGDTRVLPNDAVIISAGGILPTGFLKSMGIAVETKHGTA